MKKLTKTEWLKSVAKEVKNLKEFATQKEIDRLNLENLTPNNFDSCIYGQMTGNCYSQRAATLINKCCEKFTKFPEVVPFETTFKESAHLINGKVKIKKELDGREPKNDGFGYYSSLEHYITLKDAKNKNIIQFLKGEVKTLSL